ncbi:MAG: 3-hydroxyacyl-ACP dehydratase FabZ family protein [Rubripirellula sp.]
MQTFQHSFDDVTDYLHHRPPYLLVERIVSIETSQIQTEHDVSGEEFFMPGHFPGAAIFPGAMMQELASQSAGILIAAKYNPMKTFDTHDPFANEFALGVLVRINHAKYSGFARPGDKLLTTVQLNEQIGQMFDFSATITVAGTTVMRNSFRLTNIKSTLLQGSAAAT